jgi:hypothetical protein
MKRRSGTKGLTVVRTVRTLIKYEQRSIVRWGERDESVWRGQKGANVSETVLCDWNENNGTCPSCELTKESSCDLIEREEKRRQD